jgi:hypothetical protein
VAEAGGAKLASNAIETAMQQTFLMPVRLRRDSQNVRLNTHAVKRPVGIR